MEDANTSLCDPIFFLHQAYIDKIWADWQANGHSDETFYSSSGVDEGHNLQDAMWPWVGGATGYKARRPVPGIRLPDFSSEPSRVPKDFLNITVFGYE